MCEKKKAREARAHCMRPASTDVVAWYTASLGNNYATPALLDMISSPLTLNIIEQATMTIIALVVLPVIRIAPLPSSFEPNRFSVCVCSAVGCTG